MINFNIKNITFLKCFNYIEKSKDIQTYRLLENLLYEENKEINIKYSTLLNSIGIIEFLNVLKSKNIHKSVYINPSKRKNIKENMIEDFVIKNKKGVDYLKELNIKFFLKNIPNKNIVLQNDNIIDVIL